MRAAHEIDTILVVRGDGHCDRFGQIRIEGSRGDRDPVRS